MYITDKLTLNGEVIPLIPSPIVLVRFCEWAHHAVYCLQTTKPYNPLLSRLCNGLSGPSRSPGGSVPLSRATAAALLPLLCLWGCWGASCDFPPGQCSLKEAKIAKICPVASMTATTRGSPVGGNDNQAGQAPDAQSQSQPPLPQNQVRSLSVPSSPLISVLHLNILFLPCPLF